MKRSKWVRLLSVVLSILTVVGTLNIPVFAAEAGGNAQDETYPDGIVAVVVDADGNVVTDSKSGKVKQYKSFIEAWRWAADGETVKLVADTTFSSTVFFNGRGGKNEKLKYNNPSYNAPVTPTNWHNTIDLNGHTLTWTDISTTTIFKIGKGNNLTIKGPGKLVCNYGQPNGNLIWFSVGESYYSKPEEKAGHLIIEGNVTFENINTGVNANKVRHVSVICGDFDLNGEDEMDYFAMSTDSATYLDRTVNINRPIKDMYVLHTPSTKGTALTLNSKIGNLQLEHGQAQSSEYVNNKYVYTYYYDVNTCAGENFSVDSMSYMPSPNATTSNKEYQNPYTKSNDIFVIHNVSESQIKELTWKFSSTLTWTRTNGGDGRDYSYIVKLLYENGSYLLRKSVITPPVYLDPLNGVDSNSGLTDDAPVKTLERAMEVCADKKYSTIILMNTLTVSETATWEGQKYDGEFDLQILRYTESGAFKNEMVKVESGATLNLKNIVIDGGSTYIPSGSSSGYAVNTAMVNVAGGATLVVSDGAVLRNNRNTNIKNFEKRSDKYNGKILDLTTYGGGAVNNHNGGTVILNGGSIQNCSAPFGAGIYNEGIVWMTAGEISGCETSPYAPMISGYSDKYRDGGGVMNARKNAKMYFIGGSILNCSAKNGGGIAVGSGYFSNFGGGKLYMMPLKEIIEDKFADGAAIPVEVAATAGRAEALIDHCTAVENGGGIYVSACAKAENCVSEAHVTAGTLSYNHASGNVWSGGHKYLYPGGAIYVNGLAGHNSGWLYLENAEISGNRAAYAGGAIATCPSSNVYFYLSNGAVIHDNSCKQGSDISVESGWFANTYHSGYPRIALSAYMLGGGAYEWEGDYSRSSGNGLQTIERHKLEVNEYGYTKIPSDSFGTTHFYTDVSVNGREANSIAIAQQLATVHLLNNTAEGVGAGSGGAIGANGNVQIGTPDAVLRLEKLVDGTGAANHANDTFEFTVKFDGEPRADVNKQLTLIKSHNGKVVVNREPIVLDGDNSFKVELQPGDVILVEGLKDGVGYTITESDAKGTTKTAGEYTKEYSAAEGKYGTEPFEGNVVSGTILSGGVATSVTYVNTFDVGKLTVKKVVEGTGTDSDEFPQDKTFSFTVTNADGEVVDEFTIKAGEEHTTEDLEPGVYTVTENEDGAKVESWTLTVDVESEGETTVEAGKTATVTVTNKYDRRTEVPFRKDWNYPTGTTNPPVPGMLTFTLYAGENAVLGEDGKPMTVTVSASDGWEGKFENLPYYNADGTKINYTVKESEVPGWQLESAGYVDGVYVIKNTLETSLTVKKLWNGAEFTGELKVYLTRNNVRVKDNKGNDVSVTLNKAGGWTGTFEHLPACDEDGNPYIYDVEEPTVAGWQLTGHVAENGVVTLTNTELTGISVNKEWKRPDGVAIPGSVTVELLRGTEGTALAPMGDKYRVVLSEENGWADSFGDDFPMYDADGNKYVYSVREVVAEGTAWNWNAVVTGSDDGKSFTVTNYYKTSLTVNKVWLGTPGADHPNVTVHLVVNGTRTENTVTLESENGWTATFEGLAYYAEDGKTPIVYTVEEDRIDGWQLLTTRENPDGSITLVNTELFDIPVEKVWVAPKGTEVPGSVRIGLSGDYGPSHELTLNGAVNWRGAFSKLPRYALDEEGVEHLINYTLTELDRESFAGEWKLADSGYNGEGTYVFTNTKLTDVTVRKDWDIPAGMNGVVYPGSVTVTLYQNDKPYGTVELTAPTWSHTWDDLDANATYTVEETAIDGWVGTYGDVVIGGNNDTYTLTVKNAPETTKVPVEKRWNVPEGTELPDEVRVNLYRSDDPEKVLATLTLNEANGWKSEFTDLQVVYDAEGNAYTYTVGEVPVPGYEMKTPIDGNAEDGFVITNTRLTNVVVNKVWTAEDGLGHPGSVTVTLYQDNKVYGTAELNESNGWSHTWEGLDANSEYRVEEDRIVGWDVSGEDVIVKTEKNGVYTFTIENTLVTVDIPVEKHWVVPEGTNTPTQITVVLTKDGEFFKSATLDSENSWKHTFSGLRKYNDKGELIVYDVRELKVDGYKSEKSGSADDGFVFTNTKLTSITVVKDWIAPAGEELPHLTVTLLRDGAAIMTAGMPNSDGEWMCSFDDLPEADATGHKYEYTVTEAAADGYSLDGWDINIDGNAADGFILTNTKLTSIPVEKIWYTDEDTVIPDITVYLYINGSRSDKSVTLTSTNRHGEFTELPVVDSEGNTIKYEVREADVAGFASKVEPDGNGGFTITNTELTNIPVEKVWIAPEGTALPGSVTVNLYANSEPTGESLTLDSTKNWKDEFKNMPKFDGNGEPIVYTVDEVAVAGYEMKTPIDGNAEDGFVITNTRLTSLTVVKVWNGAEFDGELTVYLTRDGERVVDENGEYVTATLNAEGEWSATFDSLPACDAEGTPYVYDVEEPTVPGWELTDHSEVVNGTVTLTNTELTSIEVTKAWNVPEGFTGMPGSVTVTLWANGEPTEQRLTLTAADGWVGTFDGLLKYDGDGEPIEYTVVEDAVAGYVTSVGGSAEAGYTVTNTPLTSLTVVKVWNGGTFDGELTVYLTRDGERVVDGEGNYVTATLDAEGEWSATFGDLPLCDADGNEYDYDVEEPTVPGWELTDHSEAVNGTVTLTNTRLTSLTVVKVWNGAEFNGELVVYLTRGGERVVDENGEYVTATLDAEGEWSATFDSLPACDAEGTPYVYDVEEPAVPGWELTDHSEVVSGTVTLTNTELTSVEVTKAWNVPEGFTGIPGSVTVTLWANGEPTEQRLTLTAADGWVGTFDGLLKYDGEGEAIEYTVVEDAVAGYVASVGGSAEEGFTVTNTKLTSITVVKEWDVPEGYATPASVTVRLMAGEEQVGDAIVLSEENGWTYTWTDLDPDTEYTVTEDEMTGWVGAVGEPAANGDGNVTVTVTNTPVYTTVNVEKYWFDEFLDEIDAPEGAEITVVLYANGEATDITLTLSEEVGWAGSFTNLPMYDAEGNVIDYSVEEVEYDGFVTTIELNDNGVWVISNTETTDIPDEPPPLTDIPDDDIPTTNIPQTGDPNSFCGWSVLLFGSVIGLAIMTGELFAEKKKK